VLEAEEELKKIKENEAKTNNSVTPFKKKDEDIKASKKNKI
jgi:hypothetical protein